MKTSLRILTGLAAATVIALVPAQAQALGPAFTCDAVTYQSVGNQLKIGTVNTSSSPAVLTYTDLGPPNIEQFNAGGYSIVDNFIYALTAPPVSVLKIASDGSYVKSAAISAPAPSSGNYKAGDVAPDGHLIAIDNNTGEVWSIDVGTLATTSLGNMSAAPSVVNVADFAIVTSGGTPIAYGFDTATGALVSFPVTGTFSVSVNSSVAVVPGNGKGAAWTDSSGNLTTFANTTGEVYGVNNPSSASPLVGKVANGTPPAAGAGNDGMKCALSASAFPAPTAGLPNTGVSSAGKIGLAATGLVFLGAGAAIILARRRHSAQH